MKRIELVEGWRCAHKWVSTNCMVLAGALQGAWLYIPPDMKASVPPKLVAGVTIALLVLGVIGRMFKQGPAPDNCEDKPQ